MQILRGFWFVHFFALDSTNSPDATGTDASDSTGTDASSGMFHDRTVSPVPIEKCSGTSWTWKCCGTSWKCKTDKQHRNSVKVHEPCNQTYKTIANTRMKHAQNANQQQKDTTFFKAEICKTHIGNTHHAQYAKRRET